MNINKISQMCSHRLLKFFFCYTCMYRKKEKLHFTLHIAKSLINLFFCCNQTNNVHILISQDYNLFSFTSQRIMSVFICYFLFPRVYNYIQVFFGVDCYLE
jgi:hypothetical protein